MKQNEQPTVRLDMRVEHMRHQVSAMLSEHELDLNSMIKEGVENCFSPENVRAELKKQIHIQVNELIKNLIENVSRDVLWDKEIKNAIKAKIFEEINSRSKLLEEELKHL